MLVEWQVQEGLILPNARRLDRLNRVRAQNDDLTFEHYAALHNLWFSADTVYMTTAQICEADDLLGGKLKSGSEEDRRKELVSIAGNARVRESSWTMQEMAGSKWSGLLMRRGFADSCAIRLSDEMRGVLVTEDRELQNECWRHSIEWVDVQALRP
ncbi:MAG: hypothetical protein NTZ56_05145 [Acidobacteria bacterium]|nr:hypothetical protein [Acidobacteriota bacterium]